MTKVKICGITNLKDAELASQLGADMIGFNFYTRSSRYISPETARVISRKIRSGSKTVGIFVNESIDRVCETAIESGMDMIQLHGDETFEYIDQLKRLTGLEIIKAFRVSTDFDITQIGDFASDYILLDTFSNNEYGGSGKTFDWTVAAEVAGLYPRTILSGGLNGSNVSEAISAARPYAVDACSLLEMERGKKHPIQVEDFIRAAKATI